MRRRSTALTAIGGAAAAYILLARSRYLRWGAPDQESDGPLPGDDLIPIVDVGLKGMSGVLGHAGDTV